MLVLIDCDNFLNTDYSGIFMIGCGDGFSSIKVGFLEIMLVSVGVRTNVGAWIVIGYGDYSMEHAITL